MNTEFLAEWTNELRNGGRTQTVGALHKVYEDGSESFCCLGVAEDLLCKRGVEVRSAFDLHNSDEVRQYAYGLEEEAGVLSWNAKEYIGLPERNPDVWIGDDWYNSVAELNDMGFTFPQIADLLDYTYGS